jgi:TetR/AcrR family transcriptional repressor of nem operon
MRVTQEQLAAHRRHIVDAAADLFRARGIDGVSVAEVMGAAGLTHGGFYGHYRSKADLAADACRTSLTEAASRWRQRAAAAREAGHDPIEAVIGVYLSPAHVHDAAHGCAIPSLASESARAGGVMGGAMAAGIEGLIAVLTELSPLAAPANRDAALSALATMVGAVLLARSSADPAGILAAAQHTAVSTLRGRSP